MNKGTKRLLMFMGVAAVAAAGVTVAMSKLLIKAAVSRDGLKLPQKVTDKFSDKITGGLANDPKVKTVLEAAQIAKNLETETVSIRAKDGIELVGHVYPCENAQRIIIAMHGWRSCWETDYGCSVNFLHDQNCVMIYPDQRGQNKSGGEYIGFGVLERNDCLKWIEYAITRYGRDIPIYLLGVSMGATTVLMTSGFALPDCVKGIIADCGFTTPHSIWKHVLKNNLKINDRLAYPVVNAMLKREANYGGDEYSTIEAMKSNTKPILFIHGAEDTFVPPAMTFENYVACTAPKDLLIVPNAGHGLSYVTDTEKYQNTVKRFFKKCEVEGFDI